MSSSDSQMSDVEPVTTETNIKGLSKAFSTILSREASGKEVLLSERTELKTQELNQKAEDKLKKQLRETRKAQKANDGHVKVDILKKDYEKSLRKIANKGVVQIFNAVREFKSGQQQQSQTKSNIQAMPIDNFMDLLASK